MRASVAGRRVSSLERGRRRREKGGLVYPRAWKGRLHHASGGVRGPALPPTETHGHDAEEERDQEQDQQEHVVEDDECGGHPEGTALRARTPSRLLTPPTASLLTSTLSPSLSA